MEYQTLYLNDNGTAKVRMTVDDRVLEQDFACSNLDENVKKGMAVFKSELDRNSALTAPSIDVEIGVVVQVKSLPTIPLADLSSEG